MNKINLILILLTILNLNLSAQKYEIQGSVEGINDTICLLLKYGWEGKIYVLDSAEISNESFKFSGKEIKSGLYKIYFPSNQSNFEIIIDKSRSFSFNTKIESISKNIKFQNSRENTMFYRYLNELSEKQIKIADVQSEIENEESEELKTQLQNLGEEIIDLNNIFIKDNPNSFFSKVLIANRQLQVPDPPILENGKTDSLFQFKYYKTHFFDHMDFSDERFLRTPIFYKKIKTYLDDLTQKHPDSLIISCDYLVEKSKQNKEIFKYVVSYLTSTYERSKVMGFEKVFVHMVKKYYKPEIVDWIDKNKLREITDRAKTIEPLIIGEKAPNIRLRDPDEKIWDLHAILSDYILLIFYDPDCGHCKKEMPKIKEKHNEWINDNIDIKVMTICVELEKEKWLDFLKTYDILEWINLGEFKTVENGEYNPNNEPPFPLITHFPYLKELYDIQGTPKTYLINKDKKILVNAIKGNIGIEQVDELIRREQEIKKNRLQ